MYSDVQTKLKKALGDGIKLRKRGLFDEALSHYASIRVFFDESDPAYLRRYLNGVGVIHFNLGSHTQAVELYEQALNLPIADSYEELEDAAVKGNLANALVELRRTSEAHAFLDHAERVFREHQVDDWLGDRLETRARAYLIDSENEKAWKAINEAVGLLMHCFDEESLEIAIKTQGVVFEACKRAGLFQLKKEAVND